MRSSRCLRSERQSLRADPISLHSMSGGCSCQAPQHDFDHGETDETDNGSGIALEVAHEAAVSADPCERSLDNPSLGQHGELMHLVALDDLDDPTARVRSSKRRARPLISGIGENAQDEGPKRARRLVQHKACAVAILNIGGMDGDAQQQAERVDEDMPFATDDFLGRIIALGVEKSPPFGAPLALWLSMMAAVGLASRPSCSRKAT
jgi:hypothetical protein